jgi:predicted alpha/beta hydrolase family esterase
VSAAPSNSEGRGLSAPFLLIVPGLNGSGPAHWQTRWESLYPRAMRVAQRDWDHPECAEWRSTLEGAIAAAPEPVVLVAHSLGCALVAHLASHPVAARISAALLVAPADVDSPACTPAETRSFAPMPTAPLPFAATVVASEDDPYVSLARARHFAASWKATFVDAGRKGHLNADSGLGDWPEGRRHLEALLAGARLPGLR